MGAGASWQLLMAYPQIFAGSVISSNPAYGSAKDMERLLGNSIRTYYGEKDHEGTEARAKQAQSNWVSRPSDCVTSGSSNLSQLRASVLRHTGHGSAILPGS